MCLTENKSKKKIILLSLVGVLLVLIVSCVIYVNDYYRADENKIDAYLDNLDVKREVINEDVIVWGNEDSKNGIIFYPGGKVEYTAYEPLMATLAEEGVFCVLIKMPCNLAVLDVNAADGFLEKYPQIEKWYMAGHSLGGSMAASYIGDNEKDFEGLILLGSYSTKDLSETSLDVISIYGSEDEVLNREKYEKYEECLPKDYSEVVIDGGCHAYFGMYGKQEGDGEAEISNEQQIEITVKEIIKYIY